MRTLNIDPFWRTSVGFDRLFDLMDASLRYEPEDNFPPCNVLRTGDEVQIGATTFVADVPDAPVNGVPAAEAVVAAPGGTKLALRLELDADAAELTISFENGPTARIVRDGDGWRVEAP